MDTLGEHQLSKRSWLLYIIYIDQVDLWVILGIPTILKILVIVYDLQKVCVYVFVSNKFDNLIVMIICYLFIVIHFSNKSNTNDIIKYELGHY